ncbi:MAG: hypothetical protein O2948_07190 [Proteobacteria bacterium]|nr:hypothetical protein [Pseudomonadota bacterium]MDA0926576.1 hypothetical protein [Pseudomonadota bacterium]
MELIVFFLAMILFGSALYLVMCFFFFAMTARPLLRSFKVCWKMSIGSIVGLPLLGFGAVLLPALVFNGALEPLPNYSKWRDIIAAFVIATIASLIMLLAAYSIAWEVFE